MGDHLHAGSRRRYAFLVDACIVNNRRWPGRFLFSLGLAYAADILPKVLLPAANVVASFHFTIGSIIGPNLGGQMINWISPGSMFTLLGIMYLLFGLAGILFRRKPEFESVLK